MEPSRQQAVLIKYGEIALKGLNKSSFENMLMKNVRKAVAQQGILKADVRKMQGRLLLLYSEEQEHAKEKVQEALLSVFGIEWFAFCIRADADIESVKDCIRKNFRIEKGTTARVTAKRANKELPFNSEEANRDIGKFLVEEYGVKISLKEHELEMCVEFVQNTALVYSEKIRGFGGLPVGIAGKVLHLLSGGIDSPPAAWLMMKRGCSVDYIHFHGFQKFDIKLNEKIIELAKILNRYSYSSRIFFVPFYHFEIESLKAPEEYRIVLFRRFMMRIAEKIAEREGIPALSTGENLSQVSSQTLDNMAVISRAVRIPILRPLLANDKNETVKLAEKIGTFSLSTQQYKDCCSIFIAKHPKTKAKERHVERIEQTLALEKAVEETLKIIEVIAVKPEQLPEQGEKGEKEKE